MKQKCCVIVLTILVVVFLSVSFAAEDFYVIPIRPNIGELDDRYVNVTGDSMTGPLDVTVSSGDAGTFTNNGASGSALVAESSASSATVDARNTAEGIGVYANATSISGITYGVWGQSNSAAGAGVYARGMDDGADLVLGGNADTGLGDDGRIYSDPAYAGSDIYLHSNDAVMIDLDEDDNESGELVVRSGADEDVFRVNESGDVSQLITGNGLVKAAVSVNCRDSGSLVNRSFNNVGGTITISDGASPGQCTIHFGFDIRNRFWAATAQASGPSRGASCAHDTLGTNDELACSLWRGDTGAGVNGDIMVLIY